MPKFFSLSLSLSLSFAMREGDGARSRGDFYIHYLECEGIAILFFNLLEMDFHSLMHEKTFI